MTSDHNLINVLTQENETLRERVAYLESALIKVGPRYDMLGLTSHESRVLGALANGRMLSKEQLLMIIYADRIDGDLPDSKIIDVYVCKARKKLRPHGVAIETVWGQGYVLTKPNADRLSEVLAPFAVAEVVA